MSEDSVADFKTREKKENAEPFSFHQGEFLLPPLPLERNSDDKAQNNPASGDQYSFHQRGPVKNPWLPDIRIEGGEKAASEKEKQSDHYIERDEKKQISKINYPDGKTREFQRDEKGELNGVVTHDQDGTSKLLKDNGKWYADLDGRKIALPGQVDLSPNGTLSLPLDDRTFRTEKPDGSIRKELVGPSGARVASSEKEDIERIVRKDGSSIETQLENGKVSAMVETSKEGKQITWKKQGEVWSSDTEPQQQRIGMTLQENGNTSYIGTDGYRHIIRAGGNELLEGPGKGKFSFDKDGRISSVEYADGKTTRKFEYEGQSNKISRITEHDNKSNKEKIYTRQGSGDTWKLSDERGKSLGTWKGEAEIAPDGSYSVRRNSTEATQWGQERQPEPDTEEEENDEPNINKNEDIDEEESPQPKPEPNSEEDEELSDEERDSDLNSVPAARPSWRNRRCPTPQPDENNDDDNTDQDTDKPQPKPSPDDADDHTDAPDPNEPDPDKPDDDVDTTEPDPDKQDDDTDTTEPDPDKQDDDSDQPDTDPERPDGFDQFSPYPWRKTGHELEAGWHTYRPDGSRSRERVSTDGSRAVFDKQGRVSAIERSDRSSMNMSYKNGKLSRVEETTASGEKRNWTESKKGDWSSDSPKQAEIRRKISFNRDGDMSYLGADGKKYTVKLDASSR